MTKFINFSLLAPGNIIAIGAILIFWSLLAWGFCEMTAENQS